MFIKGIGVISPQATHTGDFSCDRNSAQLLLRCLEPDYKAVLDPKLSRRMSRIVKMGTTAALLALKDADILSPAAIITGSGFGCMSDTETFLTAITETAEKFLNPAPFIHSTHNTISSQIAMLLACKGYNQTYVQGPISFESALLDGELLLGEGYESVLVGGVDEMTSNLLRILGRCGLWKRQPPNSNKLFAKAAKGTIAGEGAAFMLLSRTKSSQTYARLLDVETHFGSMTAEQLTAWILRFLEANRMTSAAVDLCLMGSNGDHRNDAFYRSLESTIFKQSAVARYKHLCGEYPTASAFAFAVAATFLKTGKVPASFLVSKPIRQPIRTIVIFNRSRTNHQSLMLLQACVNSPEDPV